MSRPEQSISSDRRIIKPEIAPEVVDIAYFWQLDSLYLDSFANNILPRYRYDQPLKYFQRRLDYPVSLVLRPDGTVKADTYYEVDREHRFGDCIDLCKLLLTDSDFWSWLSELEDYIGPVSVYKTLGTSPRYFKHGGHSFIVIEQQYSQKYLIIDPAFQTIAKRGYAFFPSNDPVKPDSQYRWSGNCSLVAARYQQGPDRIFVPDCDFSTAILGLSENNLIIGWGVAMGPNKLHPILPLIKTFYPDGKQITYIYDPQEGIIDIKNGTAPTHDLLQVLYKFFQVASQIQFRFSEY